MLVCCKTTTSELRAARAGALVRKISFTYTISFTPWISTRSQDNRLTNGDSFVHPFVSLAAVRRTTPPHAERANHHTHTHTHTHTHQASLLQAEQLPCFPRWFAIACLPATYLQVPVSQVISWSKLAGVVDVAVVVVVVAGALAAIFLALAVTVVALVRCRRGGLAPPSTATATTTDTSAVAMR